MLLRSVTSKLSISTYSKDIIATAWHIGNTQILSVLLVVRMLHIALFGKSTSVEINEVNVTIGTTRRETHIIVVPIYAVDALVVVLRKLHRIRAFVSVEVIHVDVISVYGSEKMTSV
jgi:hypothetical protein